MKSLNIKLPSAVTDPTGLRKLEHYYGIEFTRGASNGGGDNGYHKMIGDESLLREMRFHNQMKIAGVKNAQTTNVLNQINWRRNADNSISVLDGADGSDIIQTHPLGVYAILGGTNPVYERFIVSDKPFSYDGDEAKYYPPYGETPDYVTVLDGKVRSIRNETVQGSHGAGHVTGCTDADYGQPDAGGFPRTYLSRFAYEQYARSKNSDPNRNVPYMNVCHQDIELTAAFMFIEFRTKQLNRLLGHGLSGNAVPTAETWGQVSGFRLTEDNGETYRYYSFGTTMFVGEPATATTMMEILNNSYPLLKMFEAQLAVSDGANLETVYDSDGNPIAGKAQGVMTGIYTKTFSFNLQAALSADGEKKNWKVDCVMRIPIWRGRTRLWGHLTQWYSGYEAVKYLAEGSTRYRLYRAPSIEAISIDTDMEAKTGLGQFAFEKTYEDLGDLPAVTVATGGQLFWGKGMAKAENGTVSTCIVNNSGTDAGITNYESAIVYYTGGAQEGSFERRGFRFGDSATASAAVLREAECQVAPSNAITSIGSGFRVELDD